MKDAKNCKVLFFHTSMQLSKPALGVLEENAFG